MHMHMHTHTWCMNTNDAMTVWFSQIGDHTLGNQHPTGQGQNRALSVKKKKKSNRLSADGFIHVGTLTRPTCMGRRVRLTVRVWRLLNHALYQQYPTGQGQNRTPSVDNFGRVMIQEPTIFCICFSWQIHDADVYQCIRG